MLFVEQEKIGIYRILEDHIDINEDLLACRRDLAIIGVTVEELSRIENRRKPLLHAQLLRRGAPQKPTSISPDLAKDALVNRRGPA
jgi:hypothetical protein